MGSTSYWQAQLATRAPATVLTGDHQADVTVVGAGITGISTALYLARFGARVAVVDARRVADGASGRNAGFLLGGTSELYADAQRNLGATTAERVWRTSEANRDLVTQLVLDLRDAGIECGHRVRGSLRLAASAEELARIHDSVAALNTDKFDAEIIKREALPELLRRSYYGGSFHPADAEFQPAEFVTGIAVLAQHSGASLFEESPVHTLEKDGNAWIVRTPGGAIRSTWLVLATNAWLGEFYRKLGAEDLAPKLQPTRGQVLVTEPLAVEVCPNPCYADEGFQYWRQLSDYRLVVGGWRNTSFATEDVLDESPEEPVQGNLDAFVHETLGLRDAKIESRWAGVMAFTPDTLPIVGRVPGVDRCLVAGGYTGHGNALAVICAQALARVVNNPSDPPEEFELFDPRRPALTRGDTPPSDARAPGSGTP